MKKLVLILLILAVMCGSLSGCHKDPPPDPPPPVWGTVGYTRGDCSDIQMFSDFIECSFNTAQLGSNDNISIVRPYLSAYLKFNVVVNSTNLVAYLKTNYNSTAKKSETAMEVFNGEAKVFAFYIKEDIQAKTSIIYFDFNNTKIKIPLQALSSSNHFPLAIDNGFKDTLTFIFNSLVKIKNIRFEYKTINGLVTRHYNFEVDFRETILKMYTAMNPNGLNHGNLSMTFEEFEAIVSGVFGITQEDINNNNIAKNKIEFDFYTVGGKDSMLGFGQIDKLIIHINIEASTKNNLFSGKATVMTISLDIISIKNILIDVLPSQAELDKFIVYNKNNFIFNSKLAYKNKIYALNIDFIYDKGGDGTDIAVTVKDESNTVFEVSYSNHLMSVKYKNKTIIYNFDIDRFFGDMEEQFSALTTVQALGIFGRVVRLNSNHVVITVDTALLKAITPIINNDLYYTQYSKEDVASLYQTLGFDLVDMFDSSISIIIDLNTQFLTTKD